MLQRIYPGYEGSACRYEADGRRRIIFIFSLTKGIIYGILYVEKLNETGKEPTMSKHRVRIQVIKVYDVDVEIDEDSGMSIAAQSKAIVAAEEMQSMEIQEEGHCVAVSTDYAEYQHEIIEDDDTDLEDPPIQTYILVKE